MGIDVKMESERGEQEDAVLDPQGYLPMLLSRCRDRHWLLIFLKEREEFGLPVNRLERVRRLVSPPRFHPTRACTHK